jgi:N-acetylglucosamine transport system permease protein
VKTTDTPPADTTGEGPPVSKMTPLAAPEEKAAGGRTLNIFSHGMLILWAFMVVLPLLWAVMTSFKTDKDIFSSPWALPDTLHFDN